MQPSLDALPDRYRRLLGTLISAPSAHPPGDTGEIARLCVEAIGGQGWQIDLVSPRRGADSVILTRGSGGPNLLFLAHLDTVSPDPQGWHGNPYLAHEEDGRIYGLGAAKAKGQVAILLELARLLSAAGLPRRGRIDIALVAAAESLGDDGTVYLRKTGRLTPDRLVVCQPTGLDLVTAESGVLWVALEAFGRAAHAARPDLGDNAIDRLIRAVQAIEAKLGKRLAGRVQGDLRSTLTLTRISGGSNTNVVPAHARAELDRRLIPNEPIYAAFTELSAILRGLGEPPDSLRLTQLRAAQGYVARPDSALLSAISASIETLRGRAPAIIPASAVSDGRFFATDGCEIVSFGAGDPAMGHAANEYVPLDEMVTATAVLFDLAERLSG